VSAAAGSVDAAGVAAWLRAFAAEVAARRDELTDLDAAIGDADHGVNMDRGMQAVATKLPAAVEAGTAGEAGPVETGLTENGAAESGLEGTGHAGAPLGPLFKTVGMTLVSTVGGAAGPLYGTLFLEMGKAAADRTTLTAPEWAGVVSAGAAGAQLRGKAEAGDKTMVDALLPAAEALRAAAGSGASLPAACRAAADAAAEGMRATTPLVARKGRASYLGERSAGHQDPGATSTWLLLETAAATFAGAARGGGASGGHASTGLASGSHASTGLAPGGRASGEST
jgi:phosphoenolpyruvate---glycerone phosphotransferase subunit DhaL